MKEKLDFFQSEDDHSIFETHVPKCGINLVQLFGNAVYIDNSENELFKINEESIKKLWNN